MGQPLGSTRPSPLIPMPKESRTGPGFDREAQVTLNGLRSGDGRFETTLCMMSILGSQVLREGGAQQTAQRFIESCKLCKGIGGIRTLGDKTGQRLMDLEVDICCCMKERVQVATKLSVWGWTYTI